MHRTELSVTKLLILIIINRNNSINRAIEAENIAKSIKEHKEYLR